MAEHMVRTQVYLPQATYDALVERAKGQGPTMASQIRAALDEYLQRTQDDDEGAILQTDDPIFKMIGMFDSGLTDVAVNHDHYIYGTPKRSPIAEQVVKEPRKAAYKSRTRRPKSKR